MGSWPEIGIPLTEFNGALSNFHFNGSLWSYPTSLSAALQFVTANLCEYYPIRIPERLTVCKLAAGSGAGTTGNFDVGLYDAAGNKIVSSGSTAKTTANAERIVDVTDTDVLPGLYYLAFVADTAGTNSWAGITTSNADWMRIFGCFTQAATFPLPAAATFAAWGGSTAAHAVAAYLRGE